MIPLLSVALLAMQPIENWDVFTGHGLWSCEPPNPACDGVGVWVSWWIDLCYDCGDAYREITLARSAMSGGPYTPVGPTLVGPCPAGLSCQGVMYDGTATPGTWYYVIRWSSGATTPAGQTPEFTALAGPFPRPAPILGNVPASIQ